MKTSNIMLSTSSNDMQFVTCKSHGKSLCSPQINSLLNPSGLLISKYRVSSILYRRYFLSIDGVIAATSENSYR